LVSILHTRLARLRAIHVVDEITIAQLNQELKEVADYISWFFRVVLATFTGWKTIFLSPI
jgi:hypothetical protein